MILLSNIRLQFAIHMNSVVCADGYMEKQEMEMKWKLEIKMERQLLSCCSPSKIHVLLAFIPDYPRALPSF